MLFLKTYVDFLLEGLSKEQEDFFLEDWDQDRLEDWFGKNNHRLYFPLKKKVGEEDVSKFLLDGEESIEDQIKDYLTQVYGEQYVMDDYIKGYLIDTKNKNRQVRIGKVIKDRRLLQAFNDDPLRAGHRTATKDPIICLSKHPLDIAAMSTGRGWISCKELPNEGNPAGGEWHNYLKDEVKVLLIAYLIYPDDKKIEHPIARIVLMPYYNEQGQIYYNLHHKVYGSAGVLEDVFFSTLQAWLDHQQKDLISKKSIFTLDTKVYPDGGVKNLIVGGDRDLSHFLEMMMSSDVGVIEKNSRKIAGKYPGVLFDDKEDYEVYRSIEIDILSLSPKETEDFLSELSKNKHTEENPNTNFAIWRLDGSSLQPYEQGISLGVAYKPSPKEIVIDCGFANQTLKDELEGNLVGVFDTDVVVLSSKNSEYRVLDVWMFGEEVKPPFREEILKRLSEETIGRHIQGTFSFNEEGKIDVEGDVEIVGKNYKNILQIGDFNYVSGNFDISGAGMVSLEGAPAEVGGTFNCASNKLKSLEYSPRVVGHHFFAADNEYTSLEGGPEEVGGVYEVSGGKLKSLKGAPMTISDDFLCSNTLIENLKGAPRVVEKNFSVAYSINLTSLEGGPMEVGRDYDVTSSRRLKSFKGVAETIGGDLNIVGCVSLKEIDEYPIELGGDFNISNSGITPEILRDYYLSLANNSYDDE